MILTVAQNHIMLLGCCDDLVLPGQQLSFEPIGAVHECIAVVLNCQAGPSPFFSPEPRSPKSPKVRAARSWRESSWLQ